MKFYRQLIESIIDIPRKTYAPGVFDNADTENPKLKQKVLDMIDKQIKEFEKLAPVVSTSLIGSILTKRYRNDADLDINVLFDVPEDEQEERRVQYSGLLKDINGKNVPGTEHPVNYYVITDPKVLENNNRKADGIFSIKDNDWIKKPDEDTFEPEKYEAEFQKRVQELDIIKGELKRDIVDYQELKQLTNNDVLNLQALVNDKLEEIEDSIRRLKEIGDKLTNDRRDIFSREMTPDEIREFGKQNKLPKNVIYKMLEKYHYLKFYKYCKKILEDGEVTDDEIKDLEINEGGIFSVWDTLIRKTVKAPRIKVALQLYLKYLRQGVKDAKNKAAQHAGLGYREFGLAVKDAGLPESFTTEQREGNSVAFTFGRFNPPTIGHEKLINKVAQQPTDRYFIYLSRSQDKSKNPLTPRDKLSVMKQMFPRHARNIVINPTNMVLDLATDLYNKGFTKVIMVAGSDRVREFEGILKRYNDKRNRHGYYNFDKIDVVSAGERDPDAEGATGMSASKMRTAAEKGDITSFKLGLPSSYKNKADDLMKKVRKGMNLAAAYGGLGQVHGVGYKPIANLNEYEQNQIRDLYVREMIFNINDKVDYVKEDIQGTVKRRGTNYVVIEDNNNNLHKAWIWDCLPVAADREVEVREYDTNVDYGFTAVDRIEEDLDAQPQDKDVKKKKGTQPKKYYKQLSKDVKDKRADHFKKQDTTKGPYKAAPGDEKAKTKPSIHTKKFKQMYGEMINEKGPCWSGYKQVGMKTKNGKQVPNCVPESMSIDDAKLVDGYVPESYEIGADYANHTKEVTPGEKPSAKPIDSKDKGIEVKKEDVEKWAFSDETIDKYKKRYAEEWRKKLDEVVQRMLDKL